jgi:hypothetical protein
MHAQESTGNQRAGNYRNFNHIPGRFNASEVQIKGIFNSEKHKEIKFELLDGFPVKGVIQEKVVEPNGNIRINVISSEYPQTLFNFSAIAVPGKSYTYRSRIINHLSGEVLLLEKKDDQYFYQKFRRNKLIAE